MWQQYEFELKKKSRGFHLITEEIINSIIELSQVKRGLLHLFIQHSSASLCINENADPLVRIDMERFFNHLVPENTPYFLHTDEGPDDMPARIKSVILGSSLSIPVTHGRLNMGIWQGIYLCEHRNHGGTRKIVATLQGE